MNRNITTNVRMFLQTTVILLLTTMELNADIRLRTPLLSMGADRSEYAFQTALWRTEFLQRTDDRSEEDRNRGKTDDDPSVGLPAISESTDEFQAALNVSEMAEKLFEDEPEQIQTVVGDDHAFAGDCSATLSDWEQAVCNSTSAQKRKMKQQGPSAVTVVVGVVGAIVVFGAYFKSSRRS